MGERKLVGLPTDEFAKLPNTKLYFLKIEILGLRKPLIFKSKDFEKIRSKLLALQTLFGLDSMSDNSIEITQEEFTCKDTEIYYDVNYRESSLNSFKGELI